RPKAEGYVFFSMTSRFHPLKQEVTETKIDAIGVLAVIGTVAFLGVSAGFEVDPHRKALRPVESLTGPVVHRIQAALIGIELGHSRGEVNIGIDDEKVSEIQLSVKRREDRTEVGDLFDLIHFGIQNPLDEGTIVVPTVVGDAPQGFAIVR